MRPDLNVFCSECNHYHKLFYEWLECWTWGCGCGYSIPADRATKLRKFRDSHDGFYNLMVEENA